MLCWKCDACGELGQSPTSSNVSTLMPVGWRQRLGVARRGGSLHEVRVHACSAQCAKDYDEAELRQVGKDVVYSSAEWFVITPELAADHPVVLPAKVSRRP